MLNFNFLENCLAIVFPPHFVYAFSRKMLLMLFSLNLPNFFVCLSSVLEIMGNMCIAIVSFHGCDVITSEINLIILIKQKMQDKTLNILRTKKLWRWKKAFLITFQGLLVTNNCIRTTGVPLKFYFMLFSARTNCFLLSLFHIFFDCQLFVASPWSIPCLILIGFQIRIWIQITFKGSNCYRIKLLQKQCSRKIQTQAQWSHIMLLTLSHLRWNKTVLKH